MNNGIKDILQDGKTYSLAKNKSENWSSLMLEILCCSAKRELQDQTKG
jgi:hypothetical protein